MATPSLAMIPSGYKATKLYSVLPNTAVGDFDVSRPSGTGGFNATRVNKSGLIEEVAANVPRLDYTDGGCPVLLTEPQSRNDYLNSQAMVTQSVTTTADTYTVSFYGTGTITFSGTYTGSLVGTGANDLVQLTFTATAGSLVSTVSGTVDEAQCEKLSYVTSRIRTLGSAVTRNADVVNNAGDVNTFNSSEGVLYAEIAALADDSTLRYITISDGTVDNRIIFRYSNAPNTFVVEIKVGGVTTAILSHVFDITSFAKIALKWKENDFALWIDGIEEVAVLSGLSYNANTLNQLHFTNFNASNQAMYAKTKDLRVYKTALSDAELIELTTL